MPAPAPNADPAEVRKFDALAGRWWDPAGEFAALHRLNPLRLEYVAARVTLQGARVLDVGCGGGLLSEAMARRGATVLGIDLAAAALETAELHALEQGVAVDYREVSAEALAAERPASFAAITCMEMLEHVPQPASVLVALATLLEPGGALFVSTINRNLRSFLSAIVGAEYLLRLLPRGTHEYSRFIRPSELARAARAAGLSVADVTGILFDPLTREFRLGRDVDVNYLMHLERPRAGDR
jgi:2-polyprenyl-6-hydroxyphenyl methylase/3-demethylubiquinone-9 3-methyltransferase